MAMAGGELNNQFNQFLNDRQQTGIDYFVSFNFTVLHYCLDSHYHYHQLNHIFYIQRVNQVIE